MRKINRFVGLDAKTPATLVTVVEAITRLSARGEAEILQLISTGKIQEVFPFRLRLATDPGPDFLAEEELVEASPEPLSQAQRAAHMEESMTSTRETRAPSRSSRRRKRFPKC